MEDRLAYQYGFGFISNRIQRLYSEPGYDSINANSLESQFDPQSILDRDNRVLCKWCCVVLQVDSSDLAKEAPCELIFELFFSWCNKTMFRVR